MTFIGLKYPATLDASADFIEFTHFMYRANQKGGKDAAPPANASKIKLYVPESTPDVQNNNNWEGKSFEGPLGLVLSGISRAAIGDLGGASQAAANAFGAGAQLWTQQAAKISGMSAGQLRALNDGKVYNPNVELLYSAPSMRAYSFQFRFVAQTAAENAIIRNIILEFKKYSAPLAQGQMFEVPHIWGIRYKNPEMMGRFKYAALKTVSVQANPSTAYHTTHEDDAPIEYGLGLAFQETDIITRKDHTSGIGY